MNHLSRFELKRVCSFIRFGSVFSGIYMWSNGVTGFILVFIFIFFLFGLGRLNESM